MKLFAALLGVCSGIVLTAGSVIEINGSFAGSKPGDKVPRGWHMNRTNSPAGTGSVVREGGSLGVRIVCPDREVHYFSGKFIPVKPGESYEILCGVSGSGKAGAGFYVYDGQKQWICAGAMPAVSLKRGKREMLKYRITIPADFWKRVPAYIQANFFVTGRADAVFRDVKLEKD